MPSRIRHILIAGLALAGMWIAAHADPPSSPAAASSPAADKGLSSLLGSVKTTGDEFLPVDEAFRFDALPVGSDQVVLNWEIADGYYLYRARIKVATESTAAQLGAPQFPQGQIKN